MAQDNFVDYVKICCRSGKGGAGSMHLHRDKLTAKGGPDGGKVDVADTLFCEAIAIFGRFCI